MSDERTTLEVIAPTVEEATTKGLAELGLPLEAVDVEVLDPGSRGLFGLGSRQARIRLKIKTTPPLRDEPAAAPARPPAQAETPPPAPPVARPQPPAAPPVHEPAPESPVVAVPPVQEAGEAADADEDNSLRVARETVAELLDKMKVQATVTARYIRAQDAKDQDSIMVEIHGDDLSILIGRRSETLNALQYISSLIVGKELERWVPLLIDVEGYRARRERQLRQLARRMAEQAVATNRRQVLEPMPPNERRIIHMELRGNPDVETESIGEEPNRKVTITVKK